MKTLAFDLKPDPDNLDFGNTWAGRREPNLWAMVVSFAISNPFLLTCGLASNPYFPWSNLILCLRTGNPFPLTSTMYGESIHTLLIPEYFPP